MSSYSIYCGRILLVVVVLHFLWCENLNPPFSLPLTRSITITNRWGSIHYIHRKSHMDQLVLSTSGCNQIIPSQRTVIRKDLETVVYQTSTPSLVASFAVIGKTKYNLEKNGASLCFFTRSHYIYSPEVFCRFRLVQA
jgi:hypothetical protein